MVYINKLLLEKRGIGTETSGETRLFENVKTIKISPNDNLFESMKRTAKEIPEPFGGLAQVYDSKKKLWRLPKKEIPFSAGHGNWVELKENKNLSKTTESISKTGTIKENGYFRK